MNKEIYSLTRNKCTDGSTYISLLKLVKIGNKNPRYVWFSMIDYAGIGTAYEWEEMGYSSIEDAFVGQSDVNGGKLFKCTFSEIAESYERLLQELTIKGNE